MSYVVVIRKEGAQNELGEIYHADDLGHLFARLRRKYLAVRRPTCRFVLRAVSPCKKKAADAYIRQHYGKKRTQDIADELSAASGVRITKNMVVGHAHRIGLAAKRKLTGAPDNGRGQKTTHAARPD